MKADRPNILLIVTDHQAWHGRFAEGGFPIDLPVWRAFTAEGACFDRAYSVCPLCTPARASMLAGTYPSRHGLLWNTEYPRVDGLSDFRDDQRLYGHCLAEAGYRNAYVGKWHCGRRQVAQDFGLEGWSLPDYGKPYMSQAYRDYAERRGLAPSEAFIEHWLGHPDEVGRSHRLHHEQAFYFENASGVLAGPPEGHLDKFVANMAAEKLDELARGPQPWSLVASFWGPHHPYLPTEPFAGKVDPRAIPQYPTFDDDLATRPFRHWEHRYIRHGRPRDQWPEWSTWQEVLARAYEQQMQVDHAVGNLLASLAATGQADNTLVLWVADHGDAIGCHGGLWDKGSTFTEETARVPLAIRWPAEFAGGARSDALVTNMDVTATMLEAAGLGVPAEMDSRSLLALCRDDHCADWPDELICEHHGHHTRIAQRIVVTNRYKYVAALYDGDELYDLREDPYETSNLVCSPDHREIAREMRDRLIRHIDATQDALAAGQMRFWLEGAFGAQSPCEPLPPRETTSAHLSD
ncbi:MAG: sulfatase-like hydrolase/transferase [Phycisphaerae bacterium]